MRVGTYVLPNDFRNPVLLAKDVATLDLLSGGRFEFGIGAGRPDAAAENSMLGLAAREADIIALGLPPDASDDTAAERIAWIRDAAGERFSDIELNLNLMAVGDQVPRWIASRMQVTARDLAERGAIAALVGTTEQMCDQLVERRARLGLSYIVVSDELMDAFAPMVERLAGH